jgi:hypothetical protein
MVNTGSLRVTNLQITGSAMVLSDLTCQLQSDPDTSFSFGAASVLQPGEVVLCTKQYAVTTADIEADARDVQVTVVGDAANNQRPSDAASVSISPERRLTLAVEIMEDGCGRPMLPGQ